MRRALVVATSTYDDGGLARLVSPAQDACALTEVLSDPRTCGFAVGTVLDGTHDEIARAIEDFTVGSERGDLVLLYLSCHGLKDDQGRLYFAARNTRRDRLRSTALSAGFVNDLLFSAASRQKVLLLDCCYSGAFARGFAVKGDPAVHLGEHFDARGLVVLTASDATQYAFEGETLRGRAAPSAFTATVVEGLSTGSADLDGDGLVSVDDLYEHTRRRLAELSSAQHPRKWEFDVGGSIVLARRASATAPLESPPPVLVAAPPTATVPGHVRRGARWAAELGFLVTMLGLTVGLMSWVSSWPVLVDASDAVVPAVKAFASALVVVAIWVLVLAVLDPMDPRRRPWWRPFERWSAMLREVIRPSGLKAFSSAAVAAVPFNVIATAAASALVGAAAYRAGGSGTRDASFEIAFVVLALPPLVVRLFAPREHNRG